VTLPQDEAGLPIIAKLLAEATEQLQGSGISAPRFNAECLLCFATDEDRTSLLTRLRDSISDVQSNLFWGAVRQRLSGVPLQYIVGSWDFYGRTFLVTPDVLIPRPETERVVELALRWIGEQSEPVSVVDVGTGSGAIGVSIALESSRVRVYAVDVSSEALQIAKRNAERLGAVNIQFIESDLCDTLVRKEVRVSLCVANLPYIKLGDRETLDREVVDYEPHLALFAGDDGLTLYRRLIGQLPSVLTCHGSRCFMAEVGQGQAPVMEKWLEQTGLFSRVHTVNDFNDIGRIVVGQME